MKPRPKLIGILTAILLIAGATAGITVVSAKHTRMEKYAGLMLPVAYSPATPQAVHVTFMGVANILIDDGKHAILIDGFFTRPSRTDVILGKIEPDPVLISKSLTRAGVKKLDAIVVSHSHYDHAMDCAEIAKQTGAIVVGSASTANIARGGGVPDGKIEIMQAGGMVDVGDFHIQFIKSEHAPSGAMKIAGGNINKPFTPPVHAWKYQEGGTFSILVKHGTQNILVQSSAGFEPGALKGVSAPVIFLGVGLLGRQNDRYRDNFWKEVVMQVGAKRVIPVHFDDFMKPLSEPLDLAPRPFDEVEKAIDFVLAAGKRDGIEVRFAPVWAPVDPFAGL